MADLDSERDRRVRELLSDQSNKKDQLAVINQAQSEIGDIQSELRNHLAMEQAQDQSRLQEDQTISQAAQGMMEMEGGDQLQGQVSAMNPQTQAALGKFGVKPGKTQNTSRNQSSGRSVTQTGAVTNIKTENITNNHTDIRVTQPTIPMSQPTISVQPQKKEDNTSKFKAWLSGMFAKQQNEAEIQRKEYRKKEWNLGRTTSRLMKRIADATSGLSSRLDPKNMTSTLGGQLKWLLLIFGATMMSKFWKPTMKFLANLEGGFRAVFGLPMNDDLRQASSGTLSVIDQIKDFIGIKKGENDTLIGGIGKVFMEGIDKLIDKLKFWFEDRASALKEVEFPNIETPDFGPLGKVMAPIMEGLTDTFKGLTQYIGDLITVAMGGSKGRVKVAARKISRQAQDVFTDTTGKQTSAGDSGLVKGKGRDYMKDSDYDTFGNLKSNASSTQAMSRSLVSMFNDKSGKAHTAEIGTGVGQLFNVAKRNGQVVIDPELLGYLGLTQADVVALQRNKQLRQDKYRIIGVKPTTDAQRRELGAYTGNGGFWTGGVAGTAAGAWAGAKLGAMAGGSIGSLIPGAGTAIGAGVGGAIGLVGGAFAGGYTGSALGAAGDNIVKNWTTRGLYPKLVKADSGERGADGSLGVPKMMWVLTKEGADAVTAKFTRGMTNKDMDITNKEFYDKIRKIEERRKRQNGVRGALTQNLSTNDLQVAQSNYDAYNREWNNRFDSNDPNSWNMQHYGHWNTATDNLTGMISSAGSWTANALRNGASFVTQERLGKSDQNKRAMYTMNRLVKEGLTPEQAAGVVANIMRESGFKVGGRYWDVNGPSGGIVGWHNENLKRVESYFGKDISKVSFEDQVDYLIKELKGEVNGIKAQNRNGMASRYGFKSGANVWDVIKRTTTQTEAANVYERIFEGSQDYNKEGNRTRQEFANGYLKLYKQNPNLGNNYQSKPLPNISLSGLQEEDITSGGKIGVGWLGDSQSCVCGGLFPILVGQGLNTSFKMYARGSANATHYLGTGNTKHLSSPTTNISGFSTSSTCKDALDWMLKNKPKYCFIELGHNGMSGYQNLVNKLRGVGIKVLCIKMWSTQAAPGTGMASYSKEKMSEMYKGISADGMIDLTQIDIPKSKDGVHASKEGCAVAAREVIQQLSGAGVTKGEDQDSENFLKTHEGLFGEFSETVAGALNWAADKIETTSNKKGGESLGLGINLTKKQKAVLEDYRTYKAYTEITNEASFEQKGAKVDNTGTYFETDGGYRAYVDPTNSSALLGLSESDITTVAKYNPKTKKLETVDSSEIDIIKKSVSADITSLFSEYDGKGTTNDLMKDDKGNNQKFYIGSFSDIGAFHKVAQASFNKHRRGKIDYWIYPTRDRSKYSIVQIVSVPSNFIDLKQSGGGNDTTIGPIIYQLGKQWRRLGAPPSDKTRIDWQPIAYFFNVRFTPLASVELHKLMALLSYGKITQKDGKFYTENGQELSGTDFSNAVRYGLITQTTLTSPSGYTHTSYSVASGYNSAQANAETTFRDKEFKTKDYFGSLHAGETQKDHEKYFREHKNQFHFMNGLIYGPSGVVWGTYKDGDKNKYTLYDEETLKKSAEKSGNEGLKENQAKVREDKSRQYANDLGFVDRNDMAELWKKATSDNAITSEEQKKISARRKVKYGTAKRTKIAGNDLEYFIYFDESGNILGYKLTANQFRSFYKNATGEEELGVVNDIEGKTEKELLQKAIEVFANHKAMNLKKGWLTKRDATINEKLAEKEKLIKQYSSTTGFKNNKIKKNGLSTYQSPELEKLISYLIKKKKKVDKISYVLEREQYITYEDGSHETTTFWIPEGARQDIKNWVNQQIDRAKEELTKQRFIDNYKGSALEQNYQNILGKIEKGEMEAVYDKGKVITGAGQVVGTYTVGKDGKKNLKNLDATTVFNENKGYWDNEVNKAKFYQKYLGAVWENNKLYVYDKFGTSRVQINLKKPVSTNIDKIKVANSLQARSSKSSSWDDVNKIGDATYNAKTGYYHNDKLFGGDSNENVTNAMLSAIQANVRVSKEGVDMNQEMMDNLLEESEKQTAQGITAEKRRILQIKHEKDISASTTQTAQLMAKWAESGFTTIMDEDTRNAIKNINIKAENVRNSAVEEALSSMAAYRGMKFNVISDGSGRERYIHFTKTNAIEYSIGEDGSIKTADLGAYTKSADGKHVGISKWSDKNNVTLNDNRTFIGGSTTNIRHGGGSSTDAPVAGQNN